MTKEEFKKRVFQIINKDRRYSVEAYEFISDGVSFTTSKLKFLENGRRRHISGAELLEGISEYALTQFGPMAGEVLANWGLTDSMAIGHVVFNMADYDLLSTSEKDSLEDFRNYNFQEAFSKPFMLDQSTCKKPPVID